MKTKKKLVKDGKIMTKEDRLIHAVRRGKLKEVKELIELGADIHAQEDRALRWASYYGHTEIAEYLTYCKSLYYKMKVRRDG